MYFILSRNDCVWCDRAKQLLEEKGEAYLASFLEDSPVLTRLMLKANLKTVPQIWHNAEYIGGYDNLVEHFNDYSDDPI